MKRSPHILTLLLCIVSSLTLAEVTQAAGNTQSAGIEALAAGDAQKAISLFSLAITGNPEDFRAYNDRGVAYRMAGDLEKAEADYSRAVAIKPDYANARNNRGVLYLQQGQYDKAIKDFMEALKSEELKSKVYTNLGQAYAKKGSYHEAVEFLGAATSARPLDPRSFVFLAESLEHLGQNERALSTYQLALGLLRDASITQLIEDRVARLEKGPVDARIARPGAASAEEQSGRGLHATKSGNHQQTTKIGEQRVVLPARSVPTVAPTHEQKTVQAKGPVAESLAALDQLGRAAALEKMSPASAEIYQQGLQFLERSDPRKALIRFEDVLQLEKRKKNFAGAAWSLLEVARAYVRIGDYLAADTKFQEALKLFRQLKASQETILCLAEIAAARKSAGQEDKAASFYSLAVDQASAVGNERLARDIRDHATGKAVAREKKPLQVASTSARVDRTAAPDPRIAASGHPSVQQKDQFKPSVPSVVPKVEPVERPAGQRLAWGDADKANRTSGPSQPASREIATSTVVEQQKPTANRPNKVVLSDLSPKVSDKPLAIETKVGGDRIVASGTGLARQDPHGADRGRLERRGPEVTPRTRISEKKTPVETRITENLANLKKFRDVHNEANMIIVLENLADAYLEQKRYDKAAHCLVASLAFREKLNLNRGVEKLYQTRGSIREKLGDWVGALEDLSRALVLASEPGSPGAVQDIENRIRKLANSLGIDSVAAADAYKNLWKARLREDARGETQALYLIGRLYDQADKPAQALDYYERTAASVLADKARIYEKMGKKQLAEESFKSALETFKNLDYSRYLSLLKKSKAGGTLSRR
jgi:tetratricopeptide (TPR) repeat protein